MKTGKYLAQDSHSPFRSYLIILVVLLLVGALALGAYWFLVRPWLAERDSERYEAYEKEVEPETQEPNQTEPPTQQEPVEPETPVEPEPPQETEAQKQAKQILETMTEDEKIYQLFIVTPEALTGWSGTVTQTGETSRNAIAEKPVGGIIYFSKNLETREQTTAMIRGLQDASKLGLFISVDEEGGSVVRIADNAAMGTTWFDSMGKIGATGDTDKAFEVGKTTGTDLAGLGFNLDFAPVADVNSNPNNTVIGNRAFGSDPATVAEMVAACVKGFKESGTLCTLKHFPGHGDTNEDSHAGAATSNKTLEELMDCEFLPFKAGIEAGADVVMIGHVTLPNATSEAVPATYSYEIVTGMLREQLGFEGLVITDAMNMGAIKEDSGEAAVKALQAGVDIILMPRSLSDAHAGVKAALENGELTQEQIDEKVLRILETKIEAGIIQPQ